MKKSKRLIGLQLILRTLITLWLMIQVYCEAGFWTMICIGFLFLSNEAMNYILGQIGRKVIGMAFESR